jgi:arylsulfatase A-like enzyme
MRSLILAFLLLPWAGFQAVADDRPNIVLAIADDWSWPHASIAGEPVIRTPTFDQIAREGVLFRNAFVTAPSCTASRGALLTGQWHWRLQEGCNLWSTLPARFAVYTDLLEQAGYYVGYSGKGWSPGSETAGGRKRNPAGKRYQNFGEFLQARPAGQPFCFWFGSHDPHRPYEWKSGMQSGMKPEDARIPPCLPDTPDVRTDLCDYFAEVQRFDQDLGKIVARLRRAGELDRTLIAVTGDNGLPFPRCKANLYATGTHVPLAMRWGSRLAKSADAEPRVIDDLVSLSDLAPTFLEAAGLKPHAEMTGRSLMQLITSKPDPAAIPQRDHVLLGMERHAWARAGGLGYPMRAIRTRDFLYIRNFAPDRWPAGDPENIPDAFPGVPFADIDASPTKDVLLKRRNDPSMARLFELACGRRPAEELYDLRRDPEELKNVAGDPAYAEVQQKLVATLMAELKQTKDPRVLGKGDEFDKYPFRRPERARAKP